MRKIILLLATFGVVAASPSFARGYRPLHVRYPHEAFSAARQLILSRGLLTPEQLACSDLIRGHKAEGQVIQLTVVPRPSPACPTTAIQPAPFDLYIDTVSMSYQWTPEDAEDLQELPYLADVRAGASAR